VGKLNEQYYEHYGASRERFVPVRHFVDNDWFGERADAERSSAAARHRDWNIESGRMVLLFAGKFIDKKQPMSAIRALEKTLASRSDVHLVMVGDGPLREECERYAVSRNLPVTFAGFQNQASMPGAYAAADVLVVPSSHDETWGLVVNEAMASGLPAIVSDQVGCAPDLVIPGETGFVFHAGDDDALAASINAYAANREMFREHGAAARSRVQAYSLTSAVQGTIDAARRFAA
jgi:glycosyltransferase involved in cell wall biosynthesis